MRAPSLIAAFLLATLGFTGPAAAHVPLWAPRVSLSLALDWNKLAVEAIHRPKADTPPRVRRHTIGKLTVTAAAPARAQLDVAAYGRVEGWMRDVLIPALCACAGQTAMVATTTPAKTSHARAVMESQAAR